MNAMDVALICKALGDANRLEIVQMLSDGEKCGCKLWEQKKCLSPAKKHKLYKSSINKSIHFVQRRLSSSTRG